MDIAQIKSKLSDPREIAEFDGLDLSMPLFIEKDDYKCPGAKFINCKFNDVFRVKKVNLNYGIQFINCTFSKLIFFECTAKGNVETFNSHGEHILLNNCKIENVFAIEHGHFTGGLKITETKVSIFQMLSNHFSGIWIMKSDVDRTEGFTANICRGTGMRVEKSSFDGMVRFETNVFSSYAFLHSTFKNNVWIWGGEATHNISFNGGTYEDTFKIQTVKSQGTLTFVDVNFKKGCEVLYNDPTNGIDGGCPKIYITSGTFSSGLLIQGHPENIVYSMDTIEIASTNSLIGFIKVQRLSLNSLKLHGVNSNCVLSFDTLNVEDLQVENYSNFSTTQFLNIIGIQPNSKLKIANSYLGHTHFSNFNFQTFAAISIDNSILTEITATNVNWFGSTQLQIPRVISEATDKSVNYQLETHIANKELYRQLKYAMEKQGDRIQFLNFRQLEIEEYRQITNLRNNRFNQDRIILWLGLTNKHGQDWVRPMWMAAMFTFIFSLVIIYCQNNQLQFMLDYRNVDYYDTANIYFGNMYIFWHLLNPAHRIELLYGDTEIKGITLFWDYLSRIVLAFFIYQTISAFRKFSK